MILIFDLVCDTLLVVGPENGSGLLRSELWIYWPFLGLYLGILSAEAIGGGYIEPCPAEMKWSWFICTTEPHPNASALKSA